jgi:hypothetical protein
MFYNGFLYFLIGLSVVYFVYQYSTFILLAIFFYLFLFYYYRYDAKKYLKNHNYIPSICLSREHKNHLDAFSKKYDNNSNDSDSEYILPFYSRATTMLLFNQRKQFFCLFEMLIYKKMSFLFNPDYFEKTKHLRYITIQICRDLQIICLKLNLFRKMFENRNWILVYFPLGSLI